MSNEQSTQVAELSDKIKSVRFAMFTTLDQYGHLISQPMTNQEVDADGALWFFTSSNTDLWTNIAGSPQVNVSFAEPEDSLYVSISGTAERVVDRARIEALWNPMVAAWFPNGKDDPHVVLVKVVSKTVQYWDSKENKLTRMFEMAKAAVTGTRPELDPADHGHIKL
ncbi:pyridoxamine 5'-phosphate oxidase family protein [Massilia sp. DWR3-1-1]|uniref:pyridoxamine 5'-phosphate oxidase family protein n=1 Tax=Massilia sp. DWR3-1-1 TaxID=2804559 RepID=UPI003CF66E16